MWATSFHLIEEKQQKKYKSLKETNDQLIGKILQEHESLTVEIVNKNSITLTSITEDQKATIDLFDLTEPLPFFK